VKPWLVLVLDNVVKIENQCPTFVTVPNPLPPVIFYLPKNSDRRESWKDKLATFLHCCMRLRVRGCTVVYWTWLRKRQRLRATEKEVAMVDDYLCGRDAGKVWERVFCAYDFWGFSVPMISYLCLGFSALLSNLSLQNLILFEPINEQCRINHATSWSGVQFCYDFAQKMILCTIQMARDEQDHEILLFYSWFW
jgi:hypothetical protein